MGWVGLYLFSSYFILAFFHKCIHTAQILIACRVAVQSSIVIPIYHALYLLLHVSLVLSFNIKCGLVKIVVDIN